MTLLVLSGTIPDGLYAKESKKDVEYKWWGSQSVCHDVVKHHIKYELWHFLTSYIQKTQTLFVGLLSPSFLGPNNKYLKFSWKFIERFPLSKKAIFFSWRKITFSKSRASSHHPPLWKKAFLSGLSSEPLSPLQFCKWLVNRLFKCEVTLCPVASALYSSHLHIHTESWPMFLLGGVHLFSLGTDVKIRDDVWPFLFLICFFFFCFIYSSPSDMYCW